MSKILDAYVEMTMSIRRQNCIHAKRVTGTLARQMTKMTTRDFPGRIMKREAQKVIIMVAMERIRVERPIIIFMGKDLRKSSSA